jgi:hypothetical protein
VAIVLAGGEAGVGGGKLNMDRGELRRLARAPERGHAAELLQDAGTFFPVLPFLQ